MIAKTILRFMMFVIPFIVLISCMRAVTTGTFSMPSMNAIIANFSAIGSNSDLLSAVSTFNESSHLIDFGSVTDLASFFQQIQNFFNSVGNFFQVILQIFAVPFRVLGWLFGLF